MAENNEFSFENEQYRRTYWHTCSHVLAEAVLNGTPLPTQSGAGEGCPKNG